MKNKSYSSLFSLTGKTAVVTGGAGLLGREFSEGLAAFGAAVAVVDLKEKEAVRSAREIARKYGVKTAGVGCDVSSPKSVREMTSRVSEIFGKIDVLLNNAASKADDLDAFFAPFEKYTLDEWRRIMAVNIDGMFLVAQAIGKAMAKQKTGGSIIQTASIYGIMGPDQRIYQGSKYLGRKINTPAVYSASKGSVVALTRYLAAYWAPKNIRVNTLTPGGVESGQNSAFKRRYSARVPMGRMAKAREMVGAAVYLASDASSYVTGHNLIVDGGLHAW